MAKLDCNSFDRRLFADVALITSLRDGMNLVSYEYVACQADNAGVLVLSEFAGAAQSLGAGAERRCCCMQDECDVEVCTGYVLSTA